MILKFDFTTAVTGPLYQFFDASGTLLGAAANDASQIGAIDGLYVVDATPPATAIGVLWTCDDAFLRGASIIVSEADYETIDGYSRIEKERIELAVLAGKTTGMGANAPVFRSADDTKSRVTSTLDASGNRITVALDAT